MAKSFKTLHDDMTPEQKENANQKYRELRARYNDLEDAIAGYLGHSMTTAGAAGLAGMSEAEFVETLKARGIIKTESDNADRDKSD